MIRLLNILISSCGVSLWIKNSKQMSKLFENLSTGILSWYLSFMLFLQLCKLPQAVVVFIFVCYLIVLSRMLLILQIVGSAPGFPHGIIDPIVVCPCCLVLFSCFLCAGTKTINLNLCGCIY